MEKNTLIIDDDPVIRQFVSGVLRSRGYSVIEAENGEVGLELVRSTRPGMVICDICMEGLSGFDALERLRNDPVSSSVPFILITAEQGSRGMRRGMGLGADDYLVKPFSAADLLATVEAQERKRSVLQRNEERRLKDLRTSLSLSLPHELFTPLNGIFGFAELIQAAVPEDDKQGIREMASEILKSGERLNALMRNYLTYAQFEIFSVDPEKIAKLRCAICEVASVTIHDACMRAALKHGRATDLKIEVEEADLSIASEHLFKVVEEIADNCFKFTATGQQVEVAGKTANDVYTITLTDRGRGMTQEQVSAIGAFAQFNRAQNEQQGLGLGLAIAKRITEVYAGNLHIKSSDQGAEVSIKLPIKKYEEIQITG